MRASSARTRARPVARSRRGYGSSAASPSLSRAVTGPRRRGPSRCGTPAPCWPAGRGRRAARSGVSGSGRRLDQFGQAPVLRPTISVGSALAPRAASAPRRTRRGRCTGRRAQYSQMATPTPSPREVCLAHRGGDQLSRLARPGPATRSGSARRTAPLRSPSPPGPTSALRGQRRGRRDSPQNTRRACASRARAAAR